MTFLDQKRPDLQARDPQTWTDDRVELLKKLWADGLSASQIAGELGGITRNAVIGKVHRLGLSGRAKAPSSSVPRQRKPRAPSQMFRAPRTMMRGNTALAQMPSYDYDPEPEPELIENIIPIGQRCTLLELDRRQVPLADRRSGSAGLLLLRRQDQCRRHPIADITGASPISRRRRGATGVPCASDTMSSRA